jgi:hypothetical protein
MSGQYFSIFSENAIRLCPIAFRAKEPETISGSFSELYNNWEKILLYK